MSDSILELQAQICRAMSHTARIQIIHTLRAGPGRVCDIAAATGLPVAQVSKHLAVLKQNDLVVLRRHGRDATYEVANLQLLQICDSMRTMLAEQALRLSKVAESM